MTKSITSRHFNQDVSGAKRAAKSGPVVITDRGEPAYVLMSHSDFLRYTDKTASIVATFADPSQQADFDFEPARTPGTVRLQRFD